MRRLFFLRAPLQGGASPFLKASLIALCAGIAAPALGVVSANTVVNYTSGAISNASYNNANAALGLPTRFTGTGVFPGAVTPFNPAFLSSEIVSIGAGGSLTLQLASPAVNDPSNPFGIDLLVFGNAGYIADNFPDVVAGGLFGASNASIIEVSQNGIDWFVVPGARPDNAFPTLGYSDLTDPFAGNAGAVESNFALPVDPSFSAAGKTFAEIVAGYNGSGGGTGIDLALTPISVANFVRFSHSGVGGDFQIDAVTVVPAPMSILAFAGLAALRRRRA